MTWSWINFRFGYSRAHNTHLSAISQEYSDRETLERFFASLETTDGEQRFMRFLCSYLALT